MFQASTHASVCRIRLITCPGLRELPQKIGDASVYSLQKRHLRALFAFGLHLAKLVPGFVPELGNALFMPADLVHRLDLLAQKLAGGFTIAGGSRVLGRKKGVLEYKASLPLP